MSGVADVAERHLPDPAWSVARPFWEGCRAGELRIPRCDRCGRWVWYPAPLCPDCGGEHHVWTATAGRATLFTWVTVRLATFLRDIPTRGLRAGMPVELLFETVSEHLTLPAFRCVG